MRRIAPKAFLCGLVFIFIACGITDKITGGDKMKQAPDLWSDVPRMDGIRKSEGEMPTWLKLIVRPALGTMMRGVNNGKDAGDWDVVFFTVPGKTTKDVKDFYTPARMTTQGWERKGDNACANLNSDRVVLCAFTKRADNKDVGLAVIAAQDDQGKETSLFFLRNETTPNANANK